MNLFLFQNERNKQQGGRLQTIANFFQNLGNNNNRGSAVSGNNRRPTESPLSPEQPSSRSELLPPISNSNSKLPAIGNNSQLTVSRSHTPAYSSHGSPGASTEALSPGQKSPQPPPSPTPINTKTLEQFQYVFVVSLFVIACLSVYMCSLRYITTMEWEQGAGRLCGSISVRS